MASKLSKKKVEKRNKYKRISIIASCIALIAFAIIVTTVLTSQTNPHNEFANSAKITFSFDDGFSSGLTEAAPVLAKYGFPGVMYVSTGCIDNKGVCRSRFPADRSFLTWEEIRELKETYKWEIAAHTQNHFPLTQLSTAEKEQEITESKKTLQKQGFDAVNFASPQGDYDASTLAIIMREHATHRGFKNLGNNDWLYDNAVLRVKQVQEGVSVEDVKKAIDSAIELEQWLILVFHDIKDTPSSDPKDYEYSTANLEAIAQYVKDKQNKGQIQTLTVEQAIAHTRPNLVENHSFETRDGDAWVASSIDNVMIDYENNGSYPSPRESAKIMGTVDGANMHTELIPVEQGATYEFKVFANAIEQESGELSFVIDEHAESGEWIRAVWLGRVEPGTVSYVSAAYEPKSSAVRSIRIQTNVGKNSIGTVYLDNYQLYRIK